MSPLPKTDLRHQMLRAVAVRHVVRNCDRGAWSGPKPAGRMGCYELADGGVLSQPAVQALVELRDADLIVTIPKAGTDIWPVEATRDGRITLTRWSKGARS